MAADDAYMDDGSFRDSDEPKSSALVWEAICESKKYFDEYFNVCDRIDRTLSAMGDLARGQGFFYSDQEFDLFWASMEILKPAIYARPPKPVVTPRFSDRDPVVTKASEVLERCIASSFDRGDFNEVMLCIRDDLAIASRGAGRITYESDDGQRVCDDHVDRSDFLHEPARKWSEVGWVAFAAYMTKRDMKKRFKRADLTGAQFIARQDVRYGDGIGEWDTTHKCKVWEVWHKADNRVYWVTEGVPTFLDESEPFLDLEGFFPCPKPAYGSLKRRTLLPIPDYVRYEKHLAQINDLTRRIYDILDWVRVKGLIPSGGDVASALQNVMAKDDSVLFIAVPEAALVQGSGQMVQFLPIQEFAATIQGLLEARRELINNFYELSGISDIMRGATEAEETLGAQQLKSQYGSIRVKDKVDELQRFARDMARMAGEIIAEKFTMKNIVDMAQMNIPSRSDLENQLKDIEKAARRELDELAEQAEQMAEQARQQAEAQGQQIDPKQAEAQFQQAQQQILAKYTPQIEAIRKEVPIEAIMELLRDQKTRAFTIDIETDSTVLTDEIAEKQGRNEFLAAYATASQALIPLLSTGEAGANLAGGMLKFVLAPFRAGRELDGMIDDFVEAAPAALQQQQGGEAERALAEANQKLAEAEIGKAQAAIAKVQADAEKSRQDIQLRAAEASAKANADQQRMALELEQTQGALAETAARIRKIEADIELANAKLGIEAHREQREDIKTAADIQMRQADQQMAERGQIQSERESERNAAMGERQQSFSERQGMNADRRADRAEGRADRQLQQERRS